MFVITKDNRPTEAQRRKGAIISITGYGRHTHKMQESSVFDIKSVYFEFGEERKAIECFVDINYEGLKKLYIARFSHNFSPQCLFNAYIQYLKEGVLSDEIQRAPEHAFKSDKNIRKEEGDQFCTYVRRRAKPLLKDSQSLLHNCPFLNDFFEGGEETERIFNSLKQENMSRLKATK